MRLSWPPPARPYYMITFALAVGQRPRKVPGALGKRERVREGRRDSGGRGRERMREKGMRAWGKMTREGRFVRCDRVSRVLVPLRESERAKRMRETTCVWGRSWWERERD